MKFNFAQLVGGKGAKAPKAAKTETPAEEEETAETEEETTPETEEEDETAETDEEETTSETDEEDETAETDEEKAAKAASDKKLSVEKRVAAARKQGRLAERRRIGSIMSSKAAVGRVEAALSLAVNTGLAADAAVATLKTTPRAGRLASVMPGREPKIGADSPAADDKRVASAGARYRASRGLKD